MKKILLFFLTLSLAGCTFHADNLDFSFTPKDYTNPVPVQVNITK